MSLYNDVSVHWYNNTFKSLYNDYIVKSLSIDIYILCHNRTICSCAVSKFCCKSWCNINIHVYKQWHHLNDAAAQEHLCTCIKSSF